MAITINIHYKGNKAIEFAKEMESSGIAELVRKEKGNLGYAYYLPLQGGKEVLLIDKWESQQALDAHHHSPLMGKISSLREKFDLHMEVERYKEEQSPSSDESYIRR